MATVMKIIATLCTLAAIATTFTAIWITGDTSGRLGMTSFFLYVFSAVSWVITYVLTANYDIHEF